MRFSLMNLDDEAMFKTLLHTIRETKGKTLDPVNEAARVYSLMLALEYINSITYPPVEGIDGVEEWLEWWTGKFDQVFDTNAIIILPDQSH